MIVFDLKCGGGHVFEAWFRSSDDFARQCDGGLVACPVCGNAEVSKAVMAPNIGAKGDRAPAPISGAAPAMPGNPADMARQMLAHIAGVQAKLLEKSQWVGADFAGKARAMHEGEAPEAPIHGQATPDEARALVEDGVPVMPLLVPVVPPDALN